MRLAQGLVGWPVYPLHSVVFGAAKLNVEVKTIPFRTAFQRPLPNVKLFTGLAFPELATLVAEKLGLRVSQSELKTFSDGHLFGRIDETVRNKDVVIIQTTSRTSGERSPNDNVMEVAQLVKSAKQAGAKSVTLVAPFYGYSRSDRSVKDREVAAAKLVTDFLVLAGTDRILTTTIHNKAITSFTDNPFHSLRSLPILAQYIKENYDLSSVEVISPDQGGTKRATAFAQDLGKVNYKGVMDKRRDPDTGKLLPDPIFIGNAEDIRDKVVVIPDDLIDTAGTVCQSAEALIRLGAKKVIVAATHGFFSENAVERITRSSISEVVVANTIPLSEKARQCDKITQVSIAPVIAEYVSRLFGSDESTAELKE